MKITYFAHLKNNKHREYDEDILFSLEKMGHKVYQFDDREFDIEKMIKTANESDLFLFHKGATKEESDIEYQMSVERLKTILANIRCKKAFWYVDKVYGGREIWMNNIIPMVNVGFLVDETYIRRHNYTHLFSLKQAYGEYDIEEGEYNKKYECDIAVPATIYGARTYLVDALDKTYGDRFRVYTDVHGKDFKDLCASAKIIVSPKYPMDDFYWSARIYHVLGNGGFLIHPKLYGLQEHYKEGQDFIGYQDWMELKEKLDFFLNEEKTLIRDTVAYSGRERTLKEHTYSKRLEKLLRIVKNHG